jgi:hypothetical protein
MTLGNPTRNEAETLCNSGAYYRLFLILVDNEHLSDSWKLNL